MNQLVEVARRHFEDKPAIRESVPVLVGLYGPSGSGKTFSALRLATGMQKIGNGDIYVVDSESKRSLHYADKFAFKHIEFKAPFGSLDYLAAIEHCYNKGGRIIIVDSMSHEHEGPGGHLEYHEREVERLSGGDPGKAERVKMLAWAKPKAERRRLINSVLQMNANFIFCFRAKEKIKMPKRGSADREIKELGFMPIAGEEFLYEMTLNCLLLPNSGGIPSWHPEESGEKMMVKLPIQFKELFVEKKPLDESTGESLAKWAAGSVSPAKEKQAQSPAASSLDPAFMERVNKMVNAFLCDYGIRQGQLEAFMQRDKNLWNQADFDVMKGVYQKLRKGAKPEEFFSALLAE